jgi:hypothetical protein
MLINICRKAFTALIFTLAFVINPAYVAGCGSEEEQGQDFSEADMVALLDDFAALDPTELEVEGVHYEIELSLTQSEGQDEISVRAPSPFASKAFACGSRTFMKSASACDSITTMPIEGALTLLRVDGEERIAVLTDVPVEGSMIAGSNQLTHVTISLELDGGGLAQWSTTNGQDFSLDSFDARDVGEDGADLSFP